MVESQKDKKKKGVPNHDCKLAGQKKKSNWKIKLRG